jgi:hypothetical protein
MAMPPPIATTTAAAIASIAITTMAFIIASPPAGDFKCRVCRVFGEGGEIHEPQEALRGNGETWQGGKKHAEVDVGSFPHP